MNLRKYLKIVTVISAVSLAVGAGTYAFGQNLNIAIFIGLLADSIQVVTYVLWLFQKEVGMERVPERVEVIYKYVEKEKEEGRIADELVTRLVREGVIKEVELSSMIRNKEITLAFSYAEGISSDRIRKITKGPPLKTLLGNIGFVRAASLQNLMVAITTSLPKQLRDIDNLNLFIKQELPKEWKRISDEVRVQYPPEKYRIYEKYRTGEGFKVSYILAKSPAKDFIIDYLKKNSFTPEFERHIAGRVDRSRLRRILADRKHRVIEVVSKISIDFLLFDAPRKLRESIVSQEGQVKNKLEIKVITDYRSLNVDAIAKTLHDLLPSVEEASLQNCAKNIVTESQKCYDALKKLGIHL
jgi:hypothetical protein